MTPDTAVLCRFGLLTILIAGALTSSRLVAAEPLAAQVWYVAIGGNDDLGDGSHDAPFRTIQRAIDRAAPSDTVEVATGPYTGAGNRDLDFAGKPLLLRSATGEPADVVIDCEGGDAEPHRGFFIHTSEDSTTVIRGLTVKGGYAADWGGAIRIDAEDSGSGPITVRFENCVFRGNEAASGGGAVAVGWGYADVNHAPRFHGCRFLENSAPEGGAIYGSTGADVDCTDCRFYRNSATGGGALFFAWQSGSRYVNCVFRENTATNGGGAFLQWEQQNRFRDCVFVRNAATGSGGAFYNPQGYSRKALALPTGPPVIDEFHKRYDDDFVTCDFDSNSASEGGALYLRCLGWWRLTDCRLRGNSASTGGAVYSGWANHDTYSGCVFSENTADVGAAIHWDGEPGQDSFANVQMIACTFVRNTGAKGGIIELSNLGLCIPSLERCLIAFNDGPAITVSGQSSLPDITCTDVHANTGGDWLEPLDVRLGQDGNVSAAPLFCDAAAGDYTLFGTSPCLPGNHPDGIDCGRIGALGVGCHLPVASYVSHHSAIAEPGRCLIRWQVMGEPQPADFRVWRAVGTSEFALLVGGVPVLENGEWALADRGVESGQDYTYRVFATLGLTEPLLFETSRLHVPETLLRLRQNAPNPFNPLTTIRFDLPAAGSVRLAVCDVAGRLVRILVDGERPAGTHEVVWDGRDAGGRGMASGGYFARLEADGKLQTVRMSLVR